VSATSPVRHDLGRESRIKQSRDFARLRRDGRRTICGCLIANWQQVTSGARSRIGVVVSGKVGSSVERSRARRLLRETFRLHQHQLTRPVELVLVARPSIVGQEFARVEKDFLTALRKAGLLRNEEGRM
jgi:ribonuclease P protein component